MSSANQRSTRFSHELDVGSAFERPRATTGQPYRNTDHDASFLAMQVTRVLSDLNHPAVRTTGVVLDTHHSMAQNDLSAASDPFDVVCRLNP